MALHPTSATRRKQNHNRKATVNDKVPIDRCRECGQRVLLDTDRNGRLVAQHPDTLARHPCKNP